MKDADAKLVQTITQRVLASLRAGDGGQGVDRVAVRPPVGVCTGDYSKFTELAGQVGAPPPPTAPPTAPPPAPKEQAAPSPPAKATLRLPRIPTTPAAPVQPDAAPPLTGIITARQLEAAIAKAPDGVASIDPGAKLTPLAQDLARDKPQQIRRISPAGATTADVPQMRRPPAVATAARWLWWIDGACPVAEKAMADRAAAASRLSVGPTPHALPAAARDLAGAIARRRAVGAVVFVKQAARAMCYLNRMPTLRAALGLCEASTQQAIDDLGANVLVIEYPQHGARSVDAMLQRFMAQPPQPPARTTRELEALS